MRFYCIFIRTNYYSGFYNLVVERGASTKNFFLRRQKGQNDVSSCTRDKQKTPTKIRIRTRFASPFIVYELVTAAASATVKTPA